MIKLHHLNNSRSQRILWLLEELGLDYELIPYERNPETQLAPESLKKIHPLGKSPLLSDDADNETSSDSKSNVIAESAVIIEYLISKYGAPFKVDSEDAMTPREGSYWMHFAEGSLMPPMLLRLIFVKLKTAPMPFFVKPIAKGLADKVLKSFVTPNVKSNIKYIEDHLSGKQWFVNEQLSAADFQMSFPLEAAVARGVIDASYPNIRAYVKRIHNRPAYQAALTKAGQYDYA